MYFRTMFMCAGSRQGRVCRFSITPQRSQSNRRQIHWHLCPEQARGNHMHRHRFLKLSTSNMMVLMIKISCNYFDYTLIDRLDYYIDCFAYYTTGVATLCHSVLFILY